ncbi:hypothetical protein [Pseudoxanthomonas sp. JBR18]|uniref:hypothetical protein n=1 Tax=Pseudoxanthomonas sp. JBR18 TaxID=2969308 RepID=UPI0023061D98|nr:hypothetical protein [Pseudoxanthomonas sp. JBR18]WCE03177.1 hypothetical protein PJ250_13760 [Pseudoxanthomonas sp. JBR18]
MEGREALQELKEEVQKVIDQGQALSPEGLIQYVDLLLDSLEPQRDPATELERKKAISELHLAAYNSDRAAALQAQALNAASDLEAFRTVIQAGGIARKDLLVVNGGASVALLALLGHFVSTGKAQATTAFAPVLQSFAAGVALCVLCSALTYVSQIFYQHDETRASRFAAWAFHFLAVVAWVGGGTGFVLGAFKAANIFSMPLF